MILLTPAIVAARVVSQTAFLALAQILANKVRTLLTTLGIIIAVASIIFVVAALTGLKQFVLDEFETIGVKRVFFDGELPPSWRGKKGWRDVQLTLDEFDALRTNVQGLAFVTPMFTAGYEVQFEKEILTGVVVFGIEPAWHDIENRDITQGRRFGTVDLLERRNVCLVNESAIENLNLPKEPVGSFVLMSGRRFLIVGVVETLQLSAMFGGGESRAEFFIPLTTAMALRPDGWINYGQAELKSAATAEETIAEMRYVLRHVRELKPGEEDTFEIEVVQQFIDQFNQLAFVITAVAGSIVAISLLVGGVGIMNIMLVSVSERTREIGLRKAMGAHPAIILTQFLVEAVVLCLAGAALGLAAGQLLILAVNAIPGNPIDGLAAPPWAVLLSAGFSSAIGVAFGIFPAIKAASLDPIDALRHE
jgi:putative ABC transport system permease protein